jgi:hypothetical protein
VTPLEFMNNPYKFIKEYPMWTSRVIETTRCATCKVYHAVGAPHECAPQIEEPKS